jgi:hypothetical protein
VGRQRWLGGFGSPCADHRAGPNGLILLLNRHGPSDDLGSLASVPAPERATAAEPDAGCPHPQRVKQPLEQLEEQAVEHLLEQGVEPPAEQAYRGR